MAEVFISLSNRWSADGY